MSEEKTDRKAKLIDLGFYKHFKTGDIYEVLHVAKECNNMPNDYSGLNVVYRNVKTRSVYTRDMEEFVEALGVGKDGPVQRFQLTSKLDTPIQLFATTLRMCRLEYLRLAQQNPVFIQNRANQSFIYMVGDKIAFAQAIRLINTKTANILMQWVKEWKGTPTTGNERVRINDFREEGGAAE